VQLGIDEMTSPRTAVQLFKMQKFIGQNKDIPDSPFTKIASRYSRDFTQDPS